MNIPKIISRFIASPENPVELKRVARALGRELPRRQLDVLCRFRTEMAYVSFGDQLQSIDHTRSFAAGYVEGMLDVSTEFEVSLRQHLDTRECEQTAMGEGWGDVLSLLRDGPKLPSEIAERLGESRSNVSRTLAKMRAAELIQISPDDVFDGRTRPHELTPTGKHFLGRLEQLLPDATVQGIEVAVALVGHVLGQATSAAHELHSVAQRMLDSEDAAKQAVEVWTNAFIESGMMHDIRQPEQPVAHEVESAIKHVDVTTRPKEPLPVTVSSDEPWQRAPRVLSQVKQRTDESVPVYVRTTDTAWPAWAFALSQQDAAGQSRTIVDGDIRTRSIKPPERGFRLVYDDPATLRADRNDPTMRAFMERADEKYIVSYPGTECSDIPSGFVQLDMLSVKNENG